MANAVLATTDVIAGMQSIFGENAVIVLLGTPKFKEWNPTSTDTASVLEKPNEVDEMQEDDEEEAETRKDRVVDAALRMSRAA